ncbi:MAG: ABC transporter ATP-binding protein [Planctomycetota bacterium]
MASGKRDTVVRGLTRRFGEHLALAPLDLDLEPGTVVGLIGPNGSGKSTLMRMLVGLLRPSGGSATVAGVPLSGDGAAVRQQCTFAPGELGFYGELTCKSHLRWLLRGREGAAERRGVELLERLGLPLRSKVRTFSHGMKRQLLFAAALAPDLPLRILDEPTEGLDPSKRGEVMELLREDAGPGRTILLSSHHLGEVDAACDRLLFLNRGRLVADERAEALAERARRIVRLGWAEPPSDLGWLANVPSVESVQRRDDGLTVLLNGDDVRPLLRRLAERPDAVGPSRVEYGRLSLGELYRDLYGVEGL